MSKDDKVREILEKFDEDMSATWVIQGTRVIYHQALERIAVRENVVWDKPEFLIKEKDCAVVMAAATLGERYEWSVGEAHIGVNYRVSGKQAAYPFAMAEKRAKDRVILKLIALHGLVYSEDEADDFKNSAPPVNDREAVMREAVNSNATVELEDGEVSPINAMRRMIDQKASVSALTDFMLLTDTNAAMAAWSQEDRNNVKEYARQRLVALGWKSSRGPRE